MFKFNIETKNYVERVFIYHNDKCIGEMQHVNKGRHGEISHFFNGFIPTQLKKETLSLDLLIGNGVAEYTFNSLFSKPLNIDRFKKFYEAKRCIQDNVIIVNTPKEISSVVIDVPKKIQEVLQLPSTIILTDAEKGNVQLIDKNANIHDKLAHGIDPQGKQFVSYITINFSNIPENMFVEVAEIIDKLPFTLHCFNHVIKKEISFS